jgi:hypothetical protein
MVGGLLHELKDLVIGNFSSVIIKHAPRDCNRVAHELALIGSRSNSLVPSVLAGVPSCHHSHLMQEYIHTLAPNLSANYISPF